MLCEEPGKECLHEGNEEDAPDDNAGTGAEEEAPDQRLSVSEMDGTREISKTRADGDATEHVKGPRQEVGGRIRSQDRFGQSDAERVGQSHEDAHGQATHKPTEDSSQEVGGQ